MPRQRRGGYKIKEQWELMTMTAICARLDTVFSTWSAEQVATPRAMPCKMNTDLHRFNFSVKITNDTAVCTFNAQKILENEAFLI